MLRFHYQANWFPDAAHSQLQEHWRELYRSSRLIAAIRRPEL
jgi:hypothetical protein